MRERDNRLYELRCSRKLSQGVVGDMLNLSQTRVSAYERGRYHNECARLQDKDNKLRSQHDLEQDTFYKLCQQERYYYNNFRRGKLFEKASTKLQGEYLALFEKFKSELAGHNKKLKTKDSPARRQSMNKWIEKISDERKMLESKF